MTSEDIDISKRIIWIVHSILRQFVAVIVGYTISMMFGEKFTNWMVWHYILMSSGVVLIMFEGILFLSPHNHFSMGIRKNILSGMHGSLMGIGFIVMTLGIICAYIKHDNGHFKSTHAVLGLISWIFCLLSVLGGLLAYHSFKLKDYIKPIFLRFLHTFIGLSGFLLSIAASATGFYKFIDWKPTNTPIMMTLLILIGVGIFLRSGRTVLQRLQSVIKQ
ncbi:uncharacterized protein LOC123307419 [Coccinella septempunctata]|uniref:uncharacterized protein LOC123307419 n=1 Tax=Coccinella septempunctata TaxID=41139 RepID=UPI001D05C566|nr:uncharacterized protein LOC123307419 [Coccinella septempunctata]